jgi:hypothetical protein
VQPAGISTVLLGGVLSVLKYNLSGGRRANFIRQHYVVQVYAATMSFVLLLATVEKSQVPCEEPILRVHVNIFNFKRIHRYFEFGARVTGALSCCTYVRLAWAPL